MSTGERMTLAQAEEVANEAVRRLEYSVARIEVAGSIRRRCPTIGDIEIVCIPRWTSNPETLTGEPKVSALEQLCGVMRADGIVFTKNGERYKQFAFRGRQIDLFVVTPETWGVQLAIRTGPAEFSKRLVTQVRFGGLLPDPCHVRDGRVWRGSDALETPEERYFLALSGGRWIEPEQRR